MLDIALFARCSLSDGPGRRFVLWTRGCPHLCEGCGNFYLRRAGCHFATIDQIFQLIQKSVSDHAIEGITFSGGEPFMQARDLAEVAAAARAQGLSVASFSGFTFDELKAIPDSEALLSQLDLLFDGPYEQDKPESMRHWVGSTNQRIHFLTSRYASGVEVPGPGEVVRGPVGGVRVEEWPLKARRK